MDILIASDNHGDKTSLEKILLIHPKMDLYLHAGDSCLEPSQIQPFISCKGNCDYTTQYMEKLRIPTPYGWLVMQHSPYFSNSDLSNPENMIFINGHTHIRRNDKDYLNRYFICPGSTSRPRDSFGPGYCVLHIDASNVKVEFFDL